MTVDDDHRHMLRAVELAAGVRAVTSPNPWVGCVLVTATGDSYEGATRPPGGPHAEVVARDAAAAAGADTGGATVYVTLEPCSHHGRTPPCTDALIDAGVGRVVFSIIDPDARVAGRGKQLLEEAGISDEEGDGDAEATALLEGYIKN